ncbi:MAG TPA: DUF4129 domain-containing protein [Caldilineaceae bacterium]|nr:DUF4129 domain-containing protein [Caldilineaceae bacterium]
MSLAAMEVTWFLPFALTAFIRMQPEQVALPALLLRSGAWSPLVFFALCWGTLLAYLLSTDLLNRHGVDSPRREVMMIGLIIVTFFLTARLFLFPTRSPWDLSWLGAVLRAIFDQGPGSAAVFFLLLLNVFLWLRVAMTTDRSLTFFSVGVSFRLGLLLALVGNSLFILAAGQPVQQALLYLWLFFGFGLLAVALARVDEKAFQATQSSGGTLPWPRFAQLVAMTATTVGVAIYMSTLYTPTVLRMILGWFAPLWQLLGALALRLFSMLFFLLTPLLEWLSELIRSLLANLEPVEVGEQSYGEVDLPPSQVDFAQLLRDYALVRYALIALVLLVIFVVIALLVARTRDRALAVEAEESHADGLAFGGNPFQRLRELAGLFRRYGLRPGLLAAISVQNIYANVSRLAARQGYARGTAQPPDEYLPVLRRAFPGHEAALTRLTTLYMRVHYGDQPIDSDELATLRQDYTTLHETAKTRTELQRVS